ncbi:MAG: transposase, partial [Rickettsiales bacterium]|nr:transposase [Rickettsiales bacterium]
RILSRRAKTSNRRKLAKLKLARIHEKISNVRKDYLHKISRDIINKNQVIYLEDLNVRAMQHNHNLAKAVSDVSFRMLTDMLEYKSKLYGRELVKVNRFYASSQTCSLCGQRNEQLRGMKGLHLREWICPSCNAHHSRDINAAVNILREGQRIRQKTSAGAIPVNGRGVSQATDYCEASSSLL